MSQKVTLPDALDAMERNIRVFLDLAGKKPGKVQAQINTTSGTASIHHYTNHDGTIDCIVNFPAMDNQTVFTLREMDKWSGYFIHELSHAFYTNEHAWKQAVRENIHRLVNGMEDVRIERKLNAAGIIGNSRAQLNELLEWVVGQLPANYDPNSLKGLPWLFAMVGRVKVCGYSLPEAEKQIAKLTPEMRVFVDKVMGEIANAETTDDILVIARWIVANFKSQTQSKSNQPQPQPTQDSKPEPVEPDGQSGTSEGQDSQDSDNASQEGQEGEGDGNSQEGEGQAFDAASDKQDDSQDGKAGDGAGQSGGETQEDDKLSDSDLNAMDEVNLAPQTDKQRQDSQTRVNNGQAWNDRVITETIRRAQAKSGSMPSRTKPIAVGVSQHLDVLNKQANCCATLRTQVARVLKSEETENYERSRSSGKIDRFALTRIMAGNTSTVYAKRSISGGYETQIAVLVDGSSSMSYGAVYGAYNSAAWAASVLAYAVCQAANQVGVSSEVFQFGNYYNCTKAVNERTTDKETQKRFARIGLSAVGCTPLAESIIKASARLAAQAPYKRRMLFVMTDGQDDNGPDAVKAAVAYAERLGVEVVGLFIDTPKHNGFRHAAECKSADLAKAGLGKLVQVLSREIA